jgi:MFS transporter, YNFM family, putative membrane transport protein
MQDTPASSAMPSAMADPLPPKALDRDLTLMIVALSIAAFASAVGMRAPDLLLPQIADDFGVTPGVASIIATVFALSYGAVQFLAGPFADRIGKVRVIALACAVSLLASIVCAAAADLDQLTLARMIAGLATGAIIPIAMAFIGDSVPFDRRQAVLARFLSGQIFGLVFGQAVGGIVADTFGWRAMFLVLAVLFVVAGITVLLVGRRLARSAGAPSTVAARPPIAQLLRRRRVWLVLGVVAADGLLVFAAMAFVGSDLHDRGGMTLTEAGFMMVAFGIGGFLYTLGVSAFLRMIGRARMAVLGALLVSAGFLGVSLLPGLPWAAPGLLLVGFGFYMFHTTLQTEATQMIPEARGLGMSLFAALFFCGQSVGVAIGGAFYDTHGAVVLYALCAIGLPLLALFFSRRLTA